MLYNSHGDVVRTIGSDRITVTTYDYDAFGNDRNTANALISDSNPFRYCGEYFDTATGTYFLRARWYDPATGRFTQQDSWAYYNPNDPLSLNLYVYCYGNPIRYNDPQGNASVDLLDDQNQPDENNDPKNTGGGGNNQNVQQSVQGLNNGTTQKSSAKQGTQYTPPRGGGGVTDTKYVNEQRVDFSHGGRHLNGSDIDLNDFNTEIAKDVVNQQKIKPSGKDINFSYKGMRFVYSYFTLPNGTINVGTYRMVPLN